MARVSFLAAILWSATGCTIPEQLVGDAGPTCGVCENNVEVRCLDGGAVEHKVCKPSERCASDAPTPQCVPANALPCDLSGDAGQDLSECREMGVGDAAPMFNACNRASGYQFSARCDDPPR